MANKDKAQSLQEKLCRDFLDLDMEDRITWIRTRNEGERFALWQALASHPSLTCSMLVCLPQPYQAEALRFVCGDPQRGVPPTNRVFALVPTDEPVEWTTGSYLNKKQITRIDRKTVMPAAQAFCLLYNLGPDAPVSTNRGKLYEVPVQDSMEAVASNPADAKPAKGQKHQPTAE